MVRFILSALDWKYLFWANLDQKIKIVSLSGNLVLRLIPICRIQWGCSLFLLLILNTIFGQIWSKNSKIFVQSEIPDFGVSTPILNTIDISCRWCKLNLGPLRGHIKSRHFPERIDARRRYF